MRPEEPGWRRDDKVTRRVADWASAAGLSVVISADLCHLRLRRSIMSTASSRGGRIEGGTRIRPWKRAIRRETSADTVCVKEGHQIDFLPE